jgi:hypothetical protein
MELSALSFAKNGGTFARFDFAGTQCPSRYSKTVIARIFLKDDIGYRALFWDHDGTGVWDNGVWNVGAHPYPCGASPAVDSDGNCTTGNVAHPNQAWEIAGAGAALDFIATAGTSTYYLANGQFGTWVTIAFTDEIVNISGTNYVKRTLWPNIANTTQTIVRLQNYSTLLSNAPTTKYFGFGGSPWREVQLDENPGTKLAWLQIYSDPLSITDIGLEAARTGNSAVTSSGISSIFYSNMALTPTDISDKSGEGNDPSWSTSGRPALWAINSVNSLVFTGTQWMHRVANLLNFNANFTLTAHVKFISASDYGHIWSAIVGSEGGGDYQNSDFCGNSNSGEWRAGSVNANDGAYVTGSGITLDQYAFIALVRESSSTIKLYINPTSGSSPDIVATKSTSGRSAVGTEIIGRLNGGYNFIGNLACIKQWTKALTPTQLELEGEGTYVVETDQLHEVWTFPVGGSRLVGDINSYTWTAVGTIEDDDDGPSLPSAPPGSSISSTMAGSGTFSATLTAKKKASLSPSGSGSLAIATKAKAKLLASVAGTSTATFNTKAKAKFAVSSSCSSNFAAILYGQSHLVAFMNGNASVSINALAKLKLTLNSSGASDLSAVFKAVGKIAASMVSSSSLNINGKNVAKISIIISGNSSLSTSVDGAGKITIPIVASSGLSVSVHSAGTNQLLMEGNSSLNADLKGKGRAQLSLNGASTFEFILSGKGNLSGQFDGDSNLTEGLKGVGNSTLLLSSEASVTLAAKGRGKLATTMAGTSSASFATRGAGITKFQFQANGAGNLGILLNAKGKIPAQMLASSSIYFALIGTGRMSLFSQGNSDVTGNVKGVGKIAILMQSKGSLVVNNIDLTQANPYIAQSIGIRI